MIKPEAIDEMIEKLAKDHDFILPKENSKNYYTKICWLLSIWQKQKIVYGTNANKEAIIQSLKANLSMYRENNL